MEWSQTCTWDVSQASRLWRRVSAGLQWLKGVGIASPTTAVKVDLEVTATIKKKKGCPTGAYHKWTKALAFPDRL